MKYWNNEIHFVGMEKNYAVESQDLKCNTVQVMGAKVYSELTAWYKLHEGRCAIKIFEGVPWDGTRGFKREISDITLCGEFCGKALVVISWYPKDAVDGFAGDVCSEGHGAEAWIDLD